MVSECEVGGGFKIVFWAASEPDTLSVSESLEGPMVVVVFIATKMGSEFQKYLHFM